MNFLLPGRFRQLPNLTFVRYARPPREKLAKPENKSNIILGKTKSDKVFPKPGVSDKAVSSGNANNTEP